MTTETVRTYKAIGFANFKCLSTFTGPHNVLEYGINSAFGELHNLFQINLTSGEVYINLRYGYNLDRDQGITYYYIPVDIKDNFNIINSIHGRE